MLTRDTRNRVYIYSVYCSGGRSDVSRYEHDGQKKKKNERKTRRRSRLYYYIPQACLYETAYKSNVTSFPASGGPVVRARTYTLYTLRRPGLIGFHPHVTRVSVHDVYVCIPNSAYILCV